MADRGKSQVRFRRSCATMRNVRRLLPRGGKRDGAAGERDVAMTELPEASQTKPPAKVRFHRLMTAVVSERAKTIYIRVYTVVLFALGGLLISYPHIFELLNLKKEETRLLLLVTLLVPYIYLIFEMVASRVEESDKTLDKVVLRLE